MSNSTAIFTGLCILGLIAIDWRFNDAAYLVLWGQEFLKLIYWMAFWR
jgi:hypothetical protein